MLKEFAPNDLVLGHMAEDHGFEFALISDHFHPWTDAQGHSPLVWSVVGALAHATRRLVVGTGVTCPTTRMHPALVAQAAATSAAMMDRRWQRQAALCGDHGVLGGGRAERAPHGTSAVAQPEQEGFMRFCAREILPRLEQRRKAA